MSIHSPCNILQSHPIAAWSKSWIYRRSLAGIAGSNPAGVWLSVSCKCCVLSGRGLWDGPIPRLEDSYRLCEIIECDQGQQ